MQCHSLQYKQCKTTVMDSIQYDEQQKIWSGAKRTPFHAHDCAIGKVIHNTLRNWPDNICQIFDDDGRTLTNAEVLSWSVRIAQFLKKKGLGHQDWLSVCAKNSTYVMPVAVACFFNTSPYHAINPSLDLKTLSHIFGIAKPVLIFCDGADYEKIRMATKAWMPEIITLTEHIEGVTKIEDLLAPTQTEMFYVPEKLIDGGDQVLGILCSSGTTGLPKAVTMANNMLPTESVFVTSRSVIYAASGLDWISGIYQTLMSSMMGCTRIISSKPFNAEHFVQMVQKYKITSVSVPPRHIAALLECPAATSDSLSCVRSVLIGGSFISPATLSRAQALFKSAILVYGYGFTEASQVSGGIYNPKTGNSVGKLCAGYRACIVDDVGKNLGPNEIGEIYVDNGLKWNGYWKDPIESKRMQDEFGWFHTGDMGYFDQNNNLYIVDRKKETLKYQGMHYWPNEIEKVIAELPDVNEVCVVGIYDERHGDAAGALVVKNIDSNLSENDIKNHVINSLVVTYKQLHAGVRFVDQLPISKNGKVLRTVAKELFKTKKLDRISIILQY